MTARLSLFPENQRFKNERIDFAHHSQPGVTNQTLHGGESFNYSRPESLVSDILAVDGNIANLFFTVCNLGIGSI